jgi:GNAT superfamily N-acetyltransferase
VVRAGGSPVACLDVTVRDGIAELDGLATLQPYRGRGYGQALMARGVAYAADAGCELVVLTALVEDWPREWYARHGFTTLGPATEATRQVP